MKKSIQFATGEFLRAAKAISGAYKLIKEIDERTIEALLTLLGRSK